MNRTIRFCISLGLAVVLLLSVRIEAPCRGQDKAKDVPQGVILSAKKLEPTKKSDVIAECLVSIKHKDFPDGEVLVSFTKGTKLEKIIDGKRQPAKFEDLKKGSKVEFSGYDEILESLPPIIYPESVVILEAKK